MLIKAGQQNLAKAYRKIFIPTQGYVFIECDLSQAELRLVAWMAQEPTMLRAYQNGEDIHALTAAMIMGINLSAFMALPKGIRKAKRQEAKAVVHIVPLYLATSFTITFIYGMASSIGELKWSSRQQALVPDSLIRDIGLINS